MNDALAAAINQIPGIIKDVVKKLAPATLPIT